MEHEEILELISASLDGELTPAEQTTLQAHLDQCPTCRALQQELSGLHVACAALDAQPPAQLKEGVLQNLPPQRASGGKGLYWKRWGAMAAALAVVALAAWQLPRFITGPVKSTAITAETAVAGGAESPEAAPAAAAETPMMASLDKADALPPYVDGPAVNINAAPGYAPDPESDAYVTNDSAVSPAPQPTDSVDNAAAKENDSIRSTADAAAGGGAIDDLAKRSAQEGADSGVAMASLTFADEDVSEDVVAEEAPSTGATNAPAETREAIAEDLLTCYCGVLTLTEYEPAGDYPVEVFPGERRYTLPTGDFFALVEALEQSGQPYKLQPGLFANTRPGLVIVSDQEN